MTQGKNHTLPVPQLLIHKIMAGKLLFSPGYDKSMNFLGSSHILSNIGVSSLISNLELFDTNNVTIRSSFSDKQIKKIFKNYTFFIEWSFSYTNTNSVLINLQRKVFQ